MKIEDNKLYVIYNPWSDEIEIFELRSLGDHCIMHIESKFLNNYLISYELYKHIMDRCEILGEL